eukprot:Phypoly_transcript_15061.p1 GENE.Phypoly_transcript_15061~~Phypoly_transcript_15061.p1  ORF type:complete len:181 (+),score=6.64 Phypoly_transcript_15061:331-873(+)
MLKEVLVFVSLVITVRGQANSTTCSGYLDCSKCSAAGCIWCPNKLDVSCYELNTIPYDQCGQAAPGCPCYISDSCENCLKTVNNDCVWCADDNSCISDEERPTCLFYQQEKCSINKSAAFTLYIVPWVVGATALISGLALCFYIVYQIKRRRVQKQQYVPWLAPKPQYGSVAPYLPQQSL